MKSAVILSIIVLAVGPAAKALGASPSAYFREVFKTNDVVYAGEYHSVADDKEILTAVTADLAADGTIGAVAFEFSLASDQSVLQSYLEDASVQPNTPQEIAYFSKLNRAYPVNFNNSVYDEALRKIKIIANETGLKVCAIDDVSLAGDKDEAGVKLKKLTALPDEIKQLMQQSSRQSLTTLAKSDAIWDREGTIAASVLKCASGGKKTLVFAGFGHAVRYRQLGSATPWSSAAEYTQASAPTGVRVASVLLGLAYVDGTNSFPIFSASCRAANNFSQQTGYSAARVPQAVISACFSYPDPYTSKRTVNFLNGFDGVILGPVVTAIVDGH